MEVELTAAAAVELMAVAVSSADQESVKQAAAREVVSVVAMARTVAARVVARVVATPGTVARVGKAPIPRHCLRPPSERAM